MAIDRRFRSHTTGRRIREKRIGDNKWHFKRFGEKCIIIKRSIGAEINEYCRERWDRLELDCYLRNRWYIKESVGVEIVGGECKKLDWWV